MRTNLSNIRGVFILSVLLLAPSAVLAAQASDNHVKGTMLLTPAAEQNAMASGAVEDTLKACLGRIPVQATTGQRLLAEQSCADMEQTRKMVPGAPQF